MGKRIWLLLAAIVVQVLSGCSEIRLGTIPPPPPGVPPRVYVETYTSQTTTMSGNRWNFFLLPHEKFAQRQTAYLAKLFSQSGYTVVSQSDLQAVRGEEAPALWKMYGSGDWAQARQIARALHADYAFVIERRIEVGNPAGRMEYIYAPRLLNVATGKVYQQKKSRTLSFGGTVSSTPGDLPRDVRIAAEKAVSFESLDAVKKLLLEANNEVLALAAVGQFKHMKESDSSPAEGLEDEPGTVAHAQQGISERKAQEEAAARKRQAELTEAEKRAAEAAEKKQSEQLAWEKAELERTNREKAALELRERQAREEAEELKRKIAQVEADRIAGEKAAELKRAEELAREKTEIERRAIAQARKELEERIAREEAEARRKKAELAEAERKAQELAEKKRAEQLALEKAEQERLTAEKARQEQKERLAREEAEALRLRAEQAASVRRAAELALKTRQAARIPVFGAIRMFDREGNDVAETVSVSQVIIAGRVEDESGVAAVYVNDLEADLDEQGKFSAKALLKLGRNEIVIQAYNIYQGKIERKLVVTREKGDLAAAGGDITVVPDFHARPRPSDYAVVIGIEQYRNIPKAEFAASDAALVREYLKATGVPERNIAYLSDGQATLSDFKKTLEKWLSNQVTSSSRVTVYFSGHGAPDPATGDSYIVPFDGDPNYLEDTAYSLKRLYEKLGALKSPTVTVLLDSCFSGAGGRSVLPQGARPLVVTGEPTRLPQNVAVLSATRESQISTTSPDKKHGLFTYHLLMALRRGKESVTDIYGYMKTKVEDEARSLNVQQSPLMLPETPSRKFSLR